jgi:regulator of replication initiation timing
MNSVTVMFFSQIDELKKHIERLTVSNKNLEAENIALKVKNKTKEERLQLLEALTLRSKLTFD